MTGAGFDLALPPRIVFGAGRADELPGLVLERGSRVLVVTGSSPQRVAHLVDPLRSAARTVSTTMATAEPTLADARDAVEAGLAVDADVVVGIGGGSVIDLAKAAAMLLANGGDPLDYLEVVGEGRPITRPSLPLLAVPTTAGTGAEVTANAVLAVVEHGLKASLRSPLMVPHVALVDPGLTLDCPPAVTASAGMDALTQCLEPYVSNRANPVTDGWAGTGLRAAARGLRAAYADGADLAARSDMSLCSLMGGLALANAKLGAVHGFAGVLGGMSRAPHGAVCAALLAPVCRANLARADAGLRARYTDIGRWLTGDAAATAEDGVAWIERTCADLGVAGLAGLGLSEADTAAAVEGAARASSTKGNPVALSDEELAAVFRAAL